MKQQERIQNAINQLSSRKVNQITIDNVSEFLFQSLDGQVFPTFMIEPYVNHGVSIRFFRKDIQKECTLDVKIYPHYWSWKMHVVFTGSTYPSILTSEYSGPIKTVLGYSDLVLPEVVCEYMSEPEKFETVLSDAYEITEFDPLCVYAIVSYYDGPLTGYLRYRLHRTRIIDLNRPWWKLYYFEMIEETEQRGSRLYAVHDMTFWQSIRARASSFLFENSRIYREFREKQITRLAKQNKSISNRDILIKNPIVGYMILS